MMRAVTVPRPGEARLVEVPRPEPGPDQVVLRVAATGICGSDVELLEGTRPAPYVRYPIIPGHEWAGIVVGAGSQVQGVATGTPAVAEGIRGCERCDRCKEGRGNLCESEYAETGFTHPGAFAEYVTVPARLLHILPREADLSAAAVLEPAACVAQGLLEVAPRPGLSAAVVGSGTLGLLAVMLLRLLSPARLMLVGTRPERLELARRLGCDEYVDASSEAEIARREAAFDLVVEAATRPEGAETALRLVRRGGTVVLEGISGLPRPNLVSDRLVLSHARVQGVFGASGAAWRWVVGLFGAGLLDLGALVTHRFPLQEHERAFATLRDRSTGALKVQLLPGGSIV